MTNQVPSSAAAVFAIARLTLKRVMRGKTVWVGIVIAALPFLLALILATQKSTDVLEPIYGVELLILALIPPMFIAASIGEELEERTATYLWSRPLPRWSVLAGKLLALAPLAIGLVLASFIISAQLGAHRMPETQQIISLAIGAVATSIVAAGIAMLVPKHGMSLSIIYLLFIDVPVGEIPASIRNISVTHAADALAGHSGTPASTGAIVLAVICTGWLALAFRRIGRVET
jgi:ABC-type transport system involved in multi-copper enzyme maturation permease subunit